MWERYLKRFVAPCHTILIRPCYEAIYKSSVVIRLLSWKVWELVRTYELWFHIQLTRSNLLGKTLFLTYILIRHLLESKPVSYQREHGGVYVFDHKGAFVYQEGSDDELPTDQTRWHLFDLNDTTPGMYAFCSQVIQASSPRSERHKDSVKYHGSLRTWMELPRGRRCMSRRKPACAG